MDKINTRRTLNWLAFACMVFMIFFALGDAGLNLAVKSSRKAAWPLFLPTFVFCAGATLCFLRAISPGAKKKGYGSAAPVSVRTQKIQRTIGVTLLLWATTAVLFSIAQRCTEARGEFYGHDFRNFNRAYGSYVVSHGDHFPPLGSDSVFVAAVAHEPVFATKSLEAVEASFTAPERGESCHVNTWLNGKTFQDVPQSSQIVALYEDAFPDVFFRFPIVKRNWFRAVMYADGHQRFIPEAQWPELKKQSHIP